MNTVWFEHKCPQLFGGQDYVCRRRVVRPNGLDETEPCTCVLTTTLFLRPMELDPMTFALAPYQASL